MFEDNKYAWRRVYKVREMKGEATVVSLSLIVPLIESYAAQSPSRSWVRKSYCSRQRSSIPGRYNS